MLLLIASSLSSIAFTNDTLPKSKQVAQLQLAFRYEPTSEYKDTIGSFAFFQTRVDGAIPLYSFGDKHHITHSFGFNFGLRYTAPEVTLFQRQHDVYTVNPGLNYTVYQPNHFLLINTIGTGFADDNYTIDNPNVRLLVSTLYENFTNDKFKWRLGMVMARVSKKYYAVPMLGANVKLNPQWRVFVGYPLNTRLTYKFSDQFQTYFSVRRRTETYRLAAYNENLPNATASVLLTKVDYPIGMGIKKTIATNFTFSIEMGLLGRRQLDFLDRNESINLLAKEKLKNSYRLLVERGPYIETSLRYQFGNTKKEVNTNHGARILQILDPNDADLEDILEQH